MEKKLLNIVCAVVRKDDKYLCMQRLRKGPDYIAEKWEFPGGKVEENETDFDALRREIKEEMDWDIYVGSKLGNIKYDYPDFSIVLSAYDCMARNEDFKLLEHIDSRWLTKEDFDSIEWTAADKELIKEIWK
ncbi:mutator mutT protein [Prevotella disiens FB035-09AN]|jgi:mutator mutT protein|uniref:8-oxo-dGTP diphosphatase n=1 Tax=Prevotella disiens FB035-09AN TaxID=866771 RepID=E1KSI5_9BACT|nr:(deoxy)nucleoside triphosphate pyrophosphohydrolase [Prevotella disiens]EFL45618.1 mutator mutT protein [Prevotella disiens FB035-09AN]